MGALVDELLDQLAAEWRMEPVRVFAGFLETSLNAPAFSVSVINVSAAARNCSYSVEEIRGFADAHTGTYWESMTGLQSQRRKRGEQIVTAPSQADEEEKSSRAAALDEAQDVMVEPSRLEAMLRTACEALVASEPDLTRWDTVMGDGDCGETVKTVAVSLLAALDAGVARSGSVGRVLAELEDIVESKIGGTLGGVLGIFFVSLRVAMQRDAAIARTRGQEALWAGALTTALQNLRRYTPAKVGDRTIMDALIPFAEGMAVGGFTAGVEGAVGGAESTKGMKPRLGRATYVGVGSGDEGREIPPDPGAWAARVTVEGLLAGMA
ncbi:Dihydroxyacetone kinase like protein [Verticillium longisporum]|nr:Dihydroxyacetone kinase like protein [Verticillium longisporum]